MEVEGLPLNLKILDSIVLDYIQHENLVSTETESRHPASDTNLRGTIDHIRSLVNEGAIEPAIKLTRQCNAKILEDQQLLFQLYKEVRPTLLKVFRVVQMYVS